MGKGLPYSLAPLYKQLGNAGALNPVGTVPTALSNYVSVDEIGSDAARKSIFTIVDLPIAVISVTTGNGVGGIQIYDFPEGYLQRIGCLADLSLSVATANQADFTDNTPEGDLGIGTLAPANADALGTDATDDDWGTATAFIMTAFADAEILVPPEAIGVVDGHATATNLFINVLVDAADIDDGTTSEMLINGRVEITWTPLGDN